MKCPYCGTMMYMQGDRAGDCRKCGYVHIVDSNDQTILNETKQGENKMELTGVIEGYNKTGDKPAGIKIGESWYNASVTTEKFFEQLKNKKGSFVKLKYDIVGKSKVVSFIQLTDETASQVDTHTDETVQAPPPSAVKPLGVTIGMAMNNASRHVTEMFKIMRQEDSGKTISDIEYAKAVCDFTTALLAEMKKREWM